MNRSITILAAALLLAALLPAAGCSTPAAMGGQSPTIYFLHQSNACPCVLRACNDAAPLAAAIEAGLAEGVTFKRLDYATQAAEIEPLTAKYGLFTFPAVLALDAKGGELFKVQGQMDRAAVLQELAGLGLVSNAGK